MIESITATIPEVSSGIVWKDIPGYDGRYMASSLGEIMRCPFKHPNKLTGGYSVFPSKILKPEIKKNGYLHLQLTGTDGKNRTWTVHRLIGKTFLGATDGDGMVINHKDGNKTNNVLTNLELITASENKKHAFKIGLIPRKMNETQIAEIVKRYNAGETQRALAREFGVHYSTVFSYIKLYKEGKLEWVEL